MSAGSRDGRTVREIVEAIETGKPYTLEEVVDLQGHFDNPMVVCLLARVRSEPLPAYPSEEGTFLRAVARNAFPSARVALGVQRIAGGFVTPEEPDDMCVRCYHTRQEHDVAGCRGRRSVCNCPRFR